jgi:hypothetical protein
MQWLEVQYLYNIVFTLINTSDAGNGRFCNLHFGEKYSAPLPLHFTQLHSPMQIRLHLNPKISKMARDNHAPYIVVNPKSR